LKKIAKFLLLTPVNRPLPSSGLRSTLWKHCRTSSSGNIYHQIWH